MRITVKVKPKSHKNGVESDAEDLFGERTMVVRTTSPPENGLANFSVCKIIAEYLGIPRGKVTIVMGHTSRTKVVEVST